MADDIKKIQTELKDLEQQASSIASQLSITFINSFTSARNKAENLTEEFSKGKDITKQLGQEMRKLKNSIDSSYSLETKLNAELAKQLTSNRRNAAAKAATIQGQIAQLQNERNLNLELEYQYRELEKINDEKRKQSTLSSVIRDKIKAVNREYLSTLGILKFIINAALKSDEQTTALAKSFGITKSAAFDIRQSMVAFSRAADSSFVNVTRLFKAQQALTEQLGIAVDFGGKEQEQFARLTEIVGLSADEAGKLAKFSAATGKSTDEYVASIREAVFYAQRTNKIHVSDKDILSTISKLSAGILVKFQNNPEAIAKAVVQAKALGLTLEQIDKIGDSLLEWESSIENELQAELITGRKLNFERARAAALTGDQVVLMQEMTSQAGSLAEFQSMNVIAQNSLARAFGVNRDEMADMLLKQQMINKYGSEASKMNAKQLEDFEKSDLSLKEYLKEQDRQRSIQEKFNDAIEKMQDLIGNLVAGPFGRMLDIMISITEHTWVLAGIIGGVLAANMAKWLISLRTAGKISRATAITDIIAGAWKSLGPLPVVGAALAGAAIVGGIAYLNSQAQNVEDGIAPAGNGPFTITDAYNRTAITAKGDGLAVSPNINMGEKERKNNNTDTSQILKIIEQQQQSINRLASRPTIAYVQKPTEFNDFMTNISLKDSYEVA